MSALADTDHPGQGHPQLGQLLVQRGLLTTEQLQAALTEQNRTRHPLGETLIALGFVSAATIAQALATQHGSLLKTEYGYATGFGAESPAGVAVAPPTTVAPQAPPPVAPPAQAPPPLTVALRIPPPVTAPAPPPAPAPVLAAPGPPPVSETPPAPPVLVAPVAPVEPPPAAGPEPAPPAEADTPAARAAGLETELTTARDVVRAFAAKAEELKAERDSARAEVEAARSAVAAAEARVAELEARPPEAEAAWTEQVSELERRLDESFAQVAALGGERDELTATLAERSDRLEALEAELVEARTEQHPAASFPVDAEAFTNRIAELEDALVVEVAGRNELQAAVSERDDRIRALEELVREQPWASSERHLLFFRGADGYALVELDGPPPLPGARIVASGAEGPQVVTRVAPAPLPGHALPCAFLVAA